MKEIKYVITDPMGLYARPAGMLVKAVAPFASKITVTAPTGTADCRRLMALMKLAAKQGMELEEEGIPTKEVPIGVMVETPAAAVLAHELAKEASFFSVGTNDLTQYTLAVDRQNAKLGDFYDPYHPAQLALMAHIAKAAKDNGIWAGICGELGADPKMTEKFIEMGYTELSMAAGRILETRKRVCESEL